MYDNNSDKGERLQEFKVEALVTEDLPDIEAPLKGNEKDNRYETQVKHKYMGRQNAGEDGLGNTHLMQPSLNYIICRIKWKLRR